jgi:hypothetical protein
MKTPIAIAGLENRQVQLVAQKVPEADFVHVDGQTYRGFNKGGFTDIIVSTKGCGHQLSERLTAQLPHVRIHRCFTGGLSSITKIAREICSPRPPA